MTKPYSFSLEDKLQQERGRSSKKMQATRNDCQKVVHQMAGTVKTYFRRAMEEVRINHKRELEEARKDGYKNGMHRQRELLHSNMASKNLIAATFLFQNKDVKNCLVPRRFSVTLGRTRLAKEEGKGEKRQTYLSSSSSFPSFSALSVIFRSMSRFLSPS